MADGRIARIITGRAEIDALAKTGAPIINAKNETVQRDNQDKD
jgi:hypothetical protein